MMEAFGALVIVALPWVSIALSLILAVGFGAKWTKSMRTFSSRSVADRHAANGEREKALRALIVTPSFVLFFLTMALRSALTIADRAIDDPSRHHDGWSIALAAVGLGGVILSALGWLVYRKRTLRRAGHENESV